jgi:hypothetical protein
LNLFLLHRHGRISKGGTDAILDPPAVPLCVVEKVVYFVQDGLCCGVNLRR